MSQLERRREPYPWTWELPAAGMVAFAALAALGMQVGRGLACLLAGAGWAWPAGGDILSSLPGIVAGDASTDLDHPLAAPVHPVLLWTCLAVAEIVLLTVAVALAVWALRRWGPGRMRGMADPAEAYQLLGVTRLRQAAPIIRPDLYGPDTDPSPADTDPPGDLR